MANRLKIFLFTFVLCFVVIDKAHAEVYFQDDFEADPSNWKCADGELTKWSAGYGTCGLNYNPGTGASDRRMGPGHNGGNAMYAWKHSSVPNGYWTTADKWLSPADYSRKDFYHRWYMKVPSTIDKASSSGFKYWRYIGAPYGTDAPEIYLNNCGDTFRTGSLCLLETIQDIRLNLIPTTEFADGNWHSHEIRIKYNTDGGYDGVAQYWFDGVLRHTTNDIRWGTQSNIGLNRFGVGIGNVSDTPWYMSEWTAFQFDDVVLADEYIGPISSGAAPILSDPLPPSGTKMEKTTTTTTIGVTTDIAASCRWGGRPSLAWEDLTAFSTTGGTTHSSALPVVAGGVYQMCARCFTTSYSDDFCTSFSVDAKPKSWWWRQ